MPIQTTRKIDQYGIGYDEPILPENSRTISPETIGASDGGTLPTTGKAVIPKPFEKKPATNPYDTFNFLLKDLLTKAKGVDMTTLIAKRNTLQRAMLDRSKNTIPQEELKNYSPEQQNALAQGNMKGLETATDWANAEVSAAEKKINAFSDLYLKAAEFSEKYAESMVAPQETIDAYKTMIEASPDKMVSILSGTNDKTRAAIMKSLDWKKMQQPEKYAAGSIGEYQFYVDQEKAAGRTPMSYNEYQNMDANRKRSISTTNIYGGVNEPNRILTPAEATALGVPYGTTRGEAMTMDVTPTKPATDAQKTLASYATRLEQAEPTLQSLEQTIKNMNLVWFEAQMRLPSALQSSEFQQYMQASRNLINATLRRESGAVIAESEFVNARQQYLPLPGDSDDTLKLKRQNRKVNFENYKRGSGNAYENIDELLSGKTNQNNDPMGIR